METTKTHLRLTASGLENVIEAPEFPFGFRVYFHGAYGQLLIYNGAISEENIVAIVPANTMVVIKEIKK